MYPNFKKFQAQVQSNKVFSSQFRDIIGLGLKSDVIISQETCYVNLVSLDMNFVNHEKWINTISGFVSAALYLLDRAGIQQVCNTTHTFLLSSLHH